MKAANFNLMDAFHDVTIGACIVLGRLEDIPMNVPESHSVTDLSERESPILQRWDDSEVEPGVSQDT
ncbi:hypothetical protein [Peribacillus loiseleuriae]|uniref:hypothetical protein n=1 Tax=Peribacillus loiseleuriae TaxID=1679170 RepID=UPI0015D5AFA9|nr:hypothetical protein [Peribacillus loiseleuriae]